MARTYFLAGTASSPKTVSSQFSELINSLSQHGFTLVDSFPSDYFISVNHNPKMYRKFRNFGGSAKNSALVMLEPRAVYPSQYRRGVRKRYSLVLTPGKFSNNAKPEEFIPWPYESNPNPLNPTGEDFNLSRLAKENVDKLFFDYQKWTDRKHFLTMVNANKVSPVKDENYTLRRIYAKELDEQFLAVFGDLWDSPMSSKVRHRLSIFVFSIRNFFVPNLIHLYGNLHWKFSTSRGVIADKQEVLQKSKFSLVIENDDSYMSEKLIDSLVNGSIPVYQGPHLPSSLIPENLFFALPQNPKELIPMLLSLTESEIRNYLEDIRAFVSSKNFTSRWGKKIVFRQIADEIALCFGGSNE